MVLERRLRLVKTGAKSIDMENSVKVVFATSDMKRVDQHFGAAGCFAIYAVSPQSARLVEAVQFGRLAHDGNEDKLAAKVDAVEGCIGVYCLAAGASALTQLGAMGVQFLKVAHGTRIADLIGSLQAELRHGPSAWLGRAIGQHKPARPGRFDEMEREGWVE
jgi:nitrogen fixation protein NifX